MMIKKIFLMNVISLAFLLVLVNVAFSQNLQTQEQHQQNQNQQQQMQPQKQLPKVDDITLDKFIKAAQEIEDVKLKYMKEFQTKAEKDMNSILKKYGLDLETYKQIGTTIGQDPELMKKARQKLGK
jgi:hypothetical protein